MQLAFFEETPPALVPCPTAPPVDYFPDFLTTEQADFYLERSLAADWQRHNVSMFGKTFPNPRDETMYGDRAFEYRYGEVSLSAKRWPSYLVALRCRVRRASGIQFPFAIGNRYKGGQDSIGWHSDDSPSIGPRPVIASVSLGSTRRFKLRHKQTGATFDFDLPHGSLLVMQAGCQEDWSHSLPKTARDVGVRVNWTFRPQAG